MLILTRRVGETIVIGDDVIVTVLGNKGNQVLISINAPKSLSVHREEIYQRIQQEKSAPRTSAKEEEAPHASSEQKPEEKAPTVSVRKKRETKVDKNNDKDKKE